MVMLGWFVCSTVSMVTTNRTAGLEKTLFCLAEKCFGYRALRIGTPLSS